MKALVDEIREAGKYVFRNNKNLHPDGASCRHVGRPACFLPSLHEYYASLRRRIIKKCCRKGKKAAEIIKNAAGLKKSPQEMPKVLQEGY
jgi:hypothetical protein